MRKKLSLAFGAIAVVLLLSIAISVMEYKNMSTYVSDLIADDISSINEARKLADIANQYNLEILSVIGDEYSVRLPDFDADYFMSHCDTLRTSLSSNVIAPLADSVMYSYAAYMMTSMELQDVMKSDFIDTRSWYFERLQPRFVKLGNDIDRLVGAIYSDLEDDSRSFDNGFYRSIVPGIVAVGVAIMLLAMLLFFLIVFYVNPLTKMRNSVKSFQAYGKQYNLTFDGDDQLKDLNDSLSELCAENQTLLKRVKNNEPKGNQ